MEERRIQWGKLLWWLAVNGLVIALAFAVDPAPGGFVLVVSAIVWLVIWRRALNFATKHPPHTAERPPRTPPEDAIIVTEPVRAEPSLPSPDLHPTFYKVVFGVVIFALIAFVGGIREHQRRPYTASSSPAAVTTPDYAPQAHGKAIASFVSACPLTPEERADPYYHFCLEFRVENQSTAAIDTLQFDVYLTADATGERHRLLPVTRAGEPGTVAPFAFNGRLSPGSRITARVRGVTDRYLGKARPSGANLWAKGPDGVWNEGLIR